MEDFKFKPFNPELKRGVPHENRQCYIYSDQIPAEDAVIATYDGQGWSEYGCDWYLQDALVKGLHWCHLPLPPKP